VRREKKLKKKTERKSGKSRKEEKYKKMQVSLFLKATWLMGELYLVLGQH